MSGKIVPIGGEHRSAKSLLAEVMNDPALARCVVISLDADGEVIGWGHFEMTRPELTYAAALITRLAFLDEC